MAKETVNKSQAVRAALAELGRDAKPSDVRDWVKAKHGHEMSLNHISNIKSTMGKKGGGKGRGKAKSAATPASEATAGATITTGRKPAGSIMLEDIDAVKALAQRIGVQKLHQLIDLLGK